MIAGHLEALLSELKHDAAPEPGREVTWAAHQGLFQPAYARQHVVIPCEPASGFRIACRSEKTWCGRQLATRLQNVKLRAELRIMLWPFGKRLGYTGLDPGKPLPDFVHLYGLDNEGTIESEVREALAIAREKKVTVLVFPELAIPPGIAAAIRRTLRGHGTLGHPLLTLFGCCHRRRSGLDLNEAVLLGPDGRELHRHRKLVPYLHREGEGEHKEQLKRGTAISVLESAIGNIVPLICLDYFHQMLRDVVKDTHGNLFLTPSLSAKTTTHSNAASDLQARLKASSFVCNRWLDHEWHEDRPPEEDPEAKGTSFFRVPTSGGYVTHLKDRPHAPYLLFSLVEKRDPAAGQP